MSTTPAPINEQVRIWGPESAVSVGESEAIAYCRSLAGGHYENFSVLSSLIPAELRDDFAVVYGFCRWSDDLGDEVEDPAESLRLLDWWRSELVKCTEGRASHPVMVALAGTISRHDLPLEPFNHLIDAFVRDQHHTRYQTWEELLEYCTLSANPVGRLVLMLLGEPRDNSHFVPSDAICTALQLTNHWQDVSRDILERDRIYIPREFWRSEDFEDRLKRSARQGWAVDDTFLEESRQLIRHCVDRTWPFFERGNELIGRVSPTSAPVIGLFREGGVHILRTIESWDCETVLHRPKLSKARKFLLFARAWLGARTSRSGGRSR